ncbi:hypothetical protein BDW59DRAFT_180265 [Aspergillus cavernicola]|uniref:Uncharacterized protein n=1 Tax=Aspergillus cavernicola TaxID=176166 RepID=A0ABR4IAT6_9EURO
MDPISVFSLVDYALTLKFIYPAWEVLTLHHLRKNYSSLNQKFGTLQAIVLIAIFPDARQIVDRVEKHVLGAKTQEAIVLRKSTSEDCTMLAVAAAIVAQVAITALALEDLDKVHWTANAAFVLSLTAGGLSVFYACLVQQRMSSLLTTDDVKDFFSKPSSLKELRHLEQDLARLVSDMRKMSSSDEATVTRQRMTELESIIKQFRSKNRWKSASFHSILMVKAPTLLLKYALASFIIGLGIYFGCLAFSEVGSQKPRGSHRAVFIVYIVTSFLGLLIYYVPATLKELELSPARRYVQMMSNELSKKTHQEETEIIQNISALLNSEEQETYGEHQSDEALSWEGRLEDMGRPQHNPAQ